MIIPNKVRIGSCDYDVNVTNNAIVLEGRQCKGMIDYEYHNINIDSSIQDEQGQEQTFLHELFHGIVHSRSLDLGEDTEEIIDAIAIGMHQVIRDNHRIFIDRSEVVTCGNI
jgi:hypothetical protein